MLPRERHLGRAPVALGSQDLVDADFSRLELQRAGRHVQTPDAPGGFVHMLQGRFMLLLQAAHPMPQRQGVMGSQRLHVQDFKARRFHAALDIAHRVELAVGKHIAVDKS